MIRREWIIDTPPKIRWSQIIIRTMIITMITIVNNWFHTSAVRSSRHEALGKFGEHSRS